MTPQKTMNLRIDEPEYIEALKEEMSLPSDQATVNYIIREYRLKRFNVNLEAILDLLANYTTEVHFRDDIVKTA